MNTQSATPVAYRAYPSGSTLSMTSQIRGPMIQKSFIQIDSRTIVRVTFALPNSVWASEIYLVGDFNGWNRKATPLQRGQNGEWSTTVDLEPYRAYQFRYLCDNTHWINDAEADAYIPNFYNTDNFLVVTDPDFRRYHGEGM